MRTMGYMPTELELAELGQQIHMNCEKTGGRELRGLEGGEGPEPGRKQLRLYEAGDWGVGGQGIYSTGTNKTPTSLNAPLPLGDQVVFFSLRVPWKWQTSLSGQALQARGNSHTFVTVLPHTGFLGSCTAQL